MKEGDILICRTPLSKDGNVKLTVGRHYTILRIRMDSTHPYRMRNDRNNVHYFSEKGIYKYFSLKFRYGK